MEDFSDSELIKQSLAGQELALEQLVKRYFRQVFLFAKSYVKQNQEAEDITQETFVKLWKNLEKFDPKKNFKTWLFQIAKNTAIDFLRKHKNIKLSETLELEEMAKSLESMVDNSPLPEHLFDSQNFAAQLEAVLQTLPVNYRQVVVLKFQHDMTFQEISEITGEPLNTLKSRYRRALIMIKRQLHQNS